MTSFQVKISGRCRLYPTDENEPSTIDDIRREVAHKGILALINEWAITNFIELTVQDDQGNTLRLGPAQRSNDDATE